MDTRQAGYFTPDQIGPETAQFYEDQGFLVLLNALSGREVDELLTEAVDLCRGKRGRLDLGKTAEAKTKIGVPSAHVPTPDELEGLSDDEVLAQFLCIHNGHKCSPVIMKYLKCPGIANVLTNMIGPNVKCMQSMFFIKSAGKPGQAWHQDEDYIPTRDRSLCGAWIALDDADIENGCLHIIPGSHKPGILWPQYPHNSDQFDCTFESYDFPYTDADSVPVEVPKGTVVFFNGYTLHRSLQNVKKSGYRRALVNHYMSAESFLPWTAQEGVAQAKCDFRDVVMVAGTDPHAWKGYEDITKPHVRAAGDGGCGDGRVDIEDFKASDRKDKANL